MDKDAIERDIRLRRAYVYAPGVCLKKCSNRGKECNNCIKLNGKQTKFKAPK